MGDDGERPRKRRRSIFANVLEMVGLGGGQEEDESTTPGSEDSVGGGGGTAGGGGGGGGGGPTPSHSPAPARRPRQTLEEAAHSALRALDENATDDRGAAVSTSNSRAGKGKKKPEQEAEEGEEEGEDVHGTVKSTEKGKGKGRGEGGNTLGGEKRGGAGSSEKLNYWTADKVLTRLTYGGKPLKSLRVADCKDALTRFDLSVAGNLSELRLRLARRLCSDIAKGNSDLAGIQGFEGASFGFQFAEKPSPRAARRQRRRTSTVLKRGPETKDSPIVIDDEIMADEEDTAAGPGTSDGPEVGSAVQPAIDNSGPTGADANTSASEAPPVRTSKRKRTAKYADKAEDEVARETKSVAHTKELNKALAAGPKPGMTFAELQEAVRAMGLKPKGRKRTDLEDCWRGAAKKAGKELQKGPKEEEAASGAKGERVRPDHEGIDEPSVDGVPIKDMKVTTLRHHIKRMGLEASGRLKADLQQCLSKAVLAGHSGKGGHAPKQSGVMLAAAAAAAAAKKVSHGDRDQDGDDTNPDADAEPGRGREENAVEGSSSDKGKRTDQTDQSPVPVLPPDQVCFHKVAVSAMTPEDRREALHELDIASLRKDDNEIVHDLVDALVLRKAEAAEMRPRKQAWRGRYVYMMRKAELVDMLGDFNLDDKGKVEELRTRFRTALRKWAAEEIKLPSSDSGSSHKSSSDGGRAGSGALVAKESATEAPLGTGEAGVASEKPDSKRSHLTQHTTSDDAGSPQQKRKPSVTSRKGPVEKVSKGSVPASASRHGRKATTTTAATATATATATKAIEDVSMNAGNVQSRPVDQQVPKAAEKVASSSKSSSKATGRKVKSTVTKTGSAEPGKSNISASKLPPAGDVGVVSKDGDDDADEEMPSAVGEAHRPSRRAPRTNSKKSATAATAAEGASAAKNNGKGKANADKAKGVAPAPSTVAEESASEGETTEDEPKSGTQVRLQPEDTAPALSPPPRAETESKSKQKPGKGEDMLDSEAPPSPGPNDKASGSPTKDPADGSVGDEGRGDGGGTRGGGGSGEGVGSAGGDGDGGDGGSSSSSDGDGDGDGDDDDERSDNEKDTEAEQEQEEEDEEDEEDEKQKGEQDQEHDQEREEGRDREFAPGLEMEESTPGAAGAIGAESAASAATAASENDKEVIGDVGMDVFEDRSGEVEIEPQPMQVDAGGGFDGDTVHAAGTVPTAIGEENGGRGGHDDEDEGVCAASSEDKHVVYAAAGAMEGSGRGDWVDSVQAVAREQEDRGDDDTVEDPIERLMEEGLAEEGDTEQEDAKVLQGLPASEQLNLFSFAEETVLQSVAGQRDGKGPMGKDEDLEGMELEEGLEGTLANSDGHEGDGAKVDARVEVPSLALDAVGEEAHADAEGSAEQEGSSTDLESRAGEIAGAMALQPGGDIDTLDIAEASPERPSVENDGLKNDDEEEESGDQDGVEEALGERRSVELEAGTKGVGVVEGDEGGVEEEEEEEEEEREDMEAQEEEEEDEDEEEEEEEEDDEEEAEVEAEVEAEAQEEEEEEEEEEDEEVEEEEEEEEEEEDEAVEEVVEGQEGGEEEEEEEEGVEEEEEGGGEEEEGILEMVRKTEEETDEEDGTQEEGPKTEGEEGAEEEDEEEEDAMTAGGEVGDAAVGDTDEVAIEICDSSDEDQAMNNTAVDAAIEAQNDEMADMDASISNGGSSGGAVVASTGDESNDKGGRDAFQPPESKPLHEAPGAATAGMSDAGVDSAEAREVRKSAGAKDLRKSGVAAVASRDEAVSSLVSGSQAQVSFAADAPESGLASSLGEGVGRALAAVDGTAKAAQIDKDFDAMLGKRSYGEKLDTINFLADLTARAVNPRLPVPSAAEQRRILRGSRAANTWDASFMMRTDYEGASRDLADERARVRERGVSRKGPGEDWRSAPSSEWIGLVPSMKRRAQQPTVRRARHPSMRGDPNTGSGFMALRSPKDDSRQPSRLRSTLGYDGDELALILPRPDDQNKEEDFVMTSSSRLPPRPSLSASPYPRKYASLARTMAGTPSRTPKTDRADRTGGGLGWRGAHDRRRSISGGGSVLRYRARTRTPRTKSNLGDEGQGAGTLGEWLGGTGTGTSTEGGSRQRGGPLSGGSDEAGSSAPPAAGNKRAAASLGLQGMNATPRKKAKEEAIAEESGDLMKRVQAEAVATKEVGSILMSVVAQESKTRDVSRQVREVQVARARASARDEQQRGGAEQVSGVRRSHEQEHEHEHVQEQKRVRPSSSSFNFTFAPTSPPPTPQTTSSAKASAGSEFDFKIPRASGRLQQRDRDSSSGGGDLAITGGGAGASDADFAFALAPSHRAPVRRESSHFCFSDALPVKRKASGRDKSAGALSLVYDEGVHEDDDLGDDTAGAFEFSIQPRKARKTRRGVAAGRTAAEQVAPLAVAPLEVDGGSVPSGGGGSGGGGGGGGSRSSAPAPAGAATAPASAPITNGFDMSKFRKPGEWKCAACLVLNPPGVDKCVSCETPKPGPTGSGVGATSAGGLLAGVSSSSSKFTFGVQSGGGGASGPSSGGIKGGLPSSLSSGSGGGAAAGAPAPAPAAPMQGGFDMSKFRKPGEWKCEACLVRNDQGATKCVSCESPKPGGEGSASAPASAGLLASNVGSTAPTFSFGVQSATAGAAEAGSAAPAASTFTFGGQPSTAASAAPPSTGFSFGAQPSTAAPAAPVSKGFTFGVQPTAPSSSAAAKAAAGEPSDKKSASRETPKPGAGVSGGGGGSSVPSGGFTFSAPSGSGAAAFGTVPASSQSADSNTSTFSGATKSVFSFGGAGGKRTRSTSTSVSAPAPAPAVAATTTGFGGGFGFSATASAPTATAAATATTSAPPAANSGAKFSFGSGTLAAPAGNSGAPALKFGSGSLPAPAGNSGAPAFTFGSGSQPAPAGNTGAPAFTFGSGSLPAPAGNSAAASPPAFSLGSQTAAPSNKKVKGPGFTFGSGSLPAPAGNSSAAPQSSFSFGSGTASGGGGGSSSSPGSSSPAPGFTFGKRPSPPS